MYRLTFILLAVLGLVLADTAEAQSVRVRGHFRKDGTYVPPHYRSRPNSTTLDNWSTRGNINPHTGEPGTRSPSSYYYLPDSTRVVPLDTTELAVSDRYRPTRVFFLHGTMNVRAGPGTHHRVLRTLRPGSILLLAPRRPDGWAQLRNGGGYIYSASSLVRESPPSPPRPAPAARRTTHPAGASAICRDGTYSYSRTRRGTCSWHGGVARWL